MDPKALSHYSSAQREKDPESKFISIYACLQRPLEVKFNIHSFGDEQDNIDASDKQRWEKLGSQDTFFEWEMVGYVSHPDIFAHNKATLLVNPLGSFDRFTCLNKGVIGNGYSNPEFVFRLYISLDVSEALLRHVNAVDRGTEPSASAADLFLKRQNSPNGWKGEEHRRNLLDVLGGEVTGRNSDLFNVRFDIINAHYYDRPQWTAFDICRIYS
jgi:hypothetical protein